MINNRHGLPYIGGMTSFAVIGGVDVRGRILTRCSRSVMAGDTGLGDSSVIKGDASPVTGVMTGITRIRGWNVCHGILAGGNHPIMTTLTASNDFGMINKCYRFPDIGGMTRLAVITGINVCSRIFSNCRRIVVTADTATVDLRMINDGHRFPHIGGMTGFARIGGVDMCRWILTRGTATIMAG